MKIMKILTHDSERIINKAELNNSKKVAFKFLFSYDKKNKII